VTRFLLATDSVHATAAGCDYLSGRLEDDSHARLDRLRLHSVASTVLGGVAVFLAWLAVPAG
jgi:hypothetical protein